MIPSLGEGWGRPHVESLSCGTPVIATNWSGVTAYLNEENGYPIAIEEVLIPSRYVGCMNCSSLRYILGDIMPRLHSPYDIWLLCIS